MKSDYLQLIALALSFSLAASCSQSNDLPSFLDADADNSCDCVLEDNCLIPEMAEGSSKERGFNCQWTEGRRGRAICTYETKFDYDDPSIANRDWSVVSVSFKKMQTGQWCWTDLD